MKRNKKDSGVADIAIRPTTHILLNNEGKKEKREK
jgi:hypothetical protein